MMRLNKIILASFSLALLVASNAPARIYNVPSEAYATIQAGIDAAQAGDTVLVAPRTWRGDGNRNLRITRNIVLLSASRADSNIIDCEFAQDVAGMLITSPCVVKGFRITNFSYNGVRCENAAGWNLIRCIIDGGNVDRPDPHRGGGMFITGGSGTVRGCIIAENVCNQAGAGIYATAGVVDMIDCVINGNNTERFGGGIIATGSNTVVNLWNCVVSANISTEDGGGMAFSVSSRGNINFCTFLRNESTGGWGGGLYKGTNSNPEVHNSIFYQNSAAQAGDQLYQQNNGGVIEISHCAVQGGIIEEDLWDGENIIDEDPELFPGREPEWGIDGYFLDPESPCIDAGNVDADEAQVDTLTTQFNLSLDEGQADIGFHYDPDNFKLIGFIFGWVRNIENANSIEGAIVRTTIGQSARTNIRGDYTIPEARIGEFDITASFPGFNDSTVTGVTLEEEDTLVFNFSLRHPDIVLSTNLIETELFRGDSTSVPFNLYNTGNGLLEWSIKPTLPDVGNINPWDVRTTYAAGTTTGDSRLEGAALVDSVFYIPGRGLNTKSIYKLNLAGQLLGSFPQPDQQYGAGSLAWDGNLLWLGGIGATIYGITREGEVIDSFPSPTPQYRYIAYDSDDQILWLCKKTSQEILAFDRFGNQINAVPQYRFRVAGLAYFPEDRDDHKLYVLHQPYIDSLFMRVYKIDTDPQREDTMYVSTIKPGSGELLSASISRDFDPYSWVMLTIANDANRDALIVYHLDANTSWMQISPILQGSLPPAETQNLFLTLYSQTLAGGLARGSLMIEHNGWQGRSFINVNLNVRLDAPNDRIQPESFTVTGVYPNPFNSTTRIAFDLPSAQQVDLQVFDTAGRLIMEQDCGRLPVGSHETTLQADLLPNGVYIFALNAGAESRVGKLVMLK